MVKILQKKMNFSEFENADHSDSRTVSLGEQSSKKNEWENTSQTPVSLEKCVMFMAKIYYSE